MKLRRGVGPCKDETQTRCRGTRPRHRRCMSRPLVSLSQSLSLSTPFFLHLHVHFMKLTLRRALRPRPFSSMLGFLDLKTGVTLVVLFAVRTLSPNFSSFPLLTLVIRCSTRSLVFTALLPCSQEQVATLHNLPYTFTPPSPSSLSRGESVPSMTFAPSFAPHPPLLLTFCLHTGESEAHALFCPHIFRRPRPEHHLDRLFCCPMVAIYPS